ncbi:MAG: hypothetical protein NZ930_00785 [Candidatus Bipolaricaulota bacterium]|nr:hypothetical protein [Candidatus Bipolaricaulota bacterium]MDW8031238.1 hypothetical protein [Candidatus Bipolaricaulota bacterium]
MHRRGVLSCVLVLVFLGGGCQPSEGPIVGQSHQSSCKALSESALGARAAIELQVVGHTLTILHRDALKNCCLMTAMEVTLKDKEIPVFEREQPGEACRCVCLRDLSVTIYHLKPGVYTVRLYHDDEPEPFWEGRAQIK